MTVILTKIDFPLCIKLKQLIESKFTLTDEIQDEIIVVMNHNSVDLLKCQYADIQVLLMAKVSHVLMGTQIRNRTRILLLSQVMLTPYINQAEFGNVVSNIHYESTESIAGGHTLSVTLSDVD